MTKLNDGVTLTFAYNGDGARFSKYDGTNTTKFVYDRRTGTPGLDPVLIETDSGGTTTARYTSEGGLIAQKRSSTTSYYHFEAIGTTRQLTNSSETATDSYTMDAWGNSLASSGSTVNPFRYVGKARYYRDTETELVIAGKRYYNPSHAQFITSDPRRFREHWFAYTSNNPQRFFDPTGLLYQENCHHMNIGFPLGPPGLSAGVQFDICATNYRCCNGSILCVRLGGGGYVGFGLSALGMFGDLDQLGTIENIAMGFFDIVVGGVLGVGLQLVAPEVNVTKCPDRGISGVLSLCLTGCLVAKGFSACVRIDSESGNFLNIEGEARWTGPCWPPGAGVSLTFGLRYCGL